MSLDPEKPFLCLSTGALNFSVMHIVERVSPIYGSISYVVDYECLSSACPVH